MKVIGLALLAVYVVLLGWNTAMNQVEDNGLGDVREYHTNEDGSFSRGPYEGDWDITREVYTMAEWDESGMVGGLLDDPNE